jgi:signal transducer and activator of transcription 5B
LNDFKNESLSWSQLNSDTLPESKATFYEWFHSYYYLIRYELADIWNDGLINGFVSKKRAEELLSQTRDGTFLLRFSESKLNAVSFSYNVEGEFGTIRL